MMSLIVALGVYSGCVGSGTSAGRCEGLWQALAHRRRARSTVVRIDNLSARIADATHSSHYTCPDLGGF